MQLTLGESRLADRPWQRWLDGLGLAPGQTLPTGEASLLGLLAEAEHLPSGAAITATAADLLRRALGDEVPASASFFALASLALAMAAEMNRLLDSGSGGRVSRSLALDRALDRAEHILRRVWHLPPGAWSGFGAWQKLVREATAPLAGGAGGGAGLHLRAA